MSHLTFFPGRTSGYSKYHFGTLPVKTVHYDFYFSFLPVATDVQRISLKCLSVQNSGLVEKVLKF